MNKHFRVLALLLHIVIFTLVTILVLYRIRLHPAFEPVVPVSNWERINAEYVGAIGELHLIPWNGSLQELLEFNKNS